MKPGSKRCRQTRFEFAFYNQTPQSIDSHQRDNSVQHDDKHRKVELRAATAAMPPVADGNHRTKSKELSCRFIKSVHTSSKSVSGLAAE
jgi:hypothetical protein